MWLLLACLILTSVDNLLPLIWLQPASNVPILDKSVVKLLLLIGLVDCREVETVFHEFGHALQHMMTQQAEGLVAGIRGVEWDAVELPSQFMENWCYNRATLNTFARHYETDEPLPEDLYKKLVAARTFRQAC